MSLHSRDIEKIRNEPFNKPWFTGFLVYVLKYIRKIPYINKKIVESAGGLSGAIFQNQADGNHLKAIEIAIFALEKFRNKKDRFTPGMEHHTWWSFMSYAVQSAKHTVDRELEVKLIKFAENGIEPFEGNFAAIVFLEFSRWEFRVKNYDKAIDYAEIASKADNTWAEPDFILGWYGIALSRGNVEKHLSNAIEKDRRILFRVANNDLCKQYPGIIKKLKSKYALEDD